MGGKPLLLLDLPRATVHAVRHHVPAHRHGAVHAADAGHLRDRHLPASPRCSGACGAAGRARRPSTWSSCSGRSSACSRAAPAAPDAIDERGVLHAAPHPQEPRSSWCSRCSWRTRSWPTSWRAKSWRTGCSARRSSTRRRSCIDDGHDRADDLRLRVLPRADLPRRVSVRAASSRCCSTASRSSSATTRPRGEPRGKLAAPAARRRVADCQATPAACSATASTAACACRPARPASTSATACRWSASTARSASTRATA